MLISATSKPVLWFRKSFRYCCRADKSLSSPHAWKQRAASENITSVRASRLAVFPNRESPIFSPKEWWTYSYLVAPVFRFLLRKSWMLWVDCWQFYSHQRVQVSNRDQKKHLKTWVSISSLTNPVQPAWILVLVDCLVFSEISIVLSLPLFGIC